jgi:hypothetical protein
MNPLQTLLNPLGLVFVNCALESHCGCYERGAGCHYCKKETPLELLRAELIFQALNRQRNP